MKRFLMFCVASVSMGLAAASVASASMSQGHTEATLNALSSSLSVTRIQSWGQVHAWDSIQNVESSPESETAVVSGQVNIGSASAKMWTDNLFVAIESLAEPPPNETSTAAGSANQRWWFTAGETDTVTFTLNYSLEQESQATLPGESAWIAGGPWLALYDSEWNYIDDVGFWGLNSGSGSWFYSDELSLSHYFNAGDQAFVWLRVESQGTANTVVPAPGAMLLGSIGLSFAGWRLHRRKTI